MPIPTNARVLVEVAADDVAGAVAAAAAGADRIELCSALELGGLTPGPGLLQRTLAEVRVPVFAMARPRAGDFVLDDDAFATLLADVRALVSAGAHGVVAGALTPDGAIDRDRTKALLAAADGRPFTFHRAFDRTADPFAALDVLLELGVARVLTSGQRPTAVEGAETIARLAARARDRLAVVAGGGVRDANVAQLVAATGVREVHLSASGWIARSSGDRRAPPPLPLGIVQPAGLGAEPRRVTDAAAVARVVAALHPR